MARHVVKILGKGCARCATTEQLVRDVVAALGADVQVEKVTRTADMIAYGVMATPSVVIDERVVHAGGVPTRSAIEAWIGDLT
jgi:small redox-active disulfide protein 2